MNCHFYIVPLLESPQDGMPVASPKEHNLEVLDLNLCLCWDVQVNDDQQPEDTYDDEDDENSENNWRNEYPDEKSSDGDEDSRGR